MEVGLSTKPNPTDVILVNGRNHMTGNLNLGGNQIISPGGINMNRKLIADLDVDPNQDLSAVNMITLKNTVNPKTDKSYVDQEIAKINTSQFVKKTGDSMSGDLITPKNNYPIPGDLNNVVNYETMRERFLSRKEAFPMETSINMNNNWIQNVKDPVNSNHGVNKKYTDSGIAKIPRVDTSKFVQKDRSTTMTGNLDIGSNHIKNISVDSSDNTSAVPKSYIDSEIAKIPRVNTSKFVHKDGSVSMTGDLNLGGFLSQNVKTPPIRGI